MAETKKTARKPNAAFMAPMEVSETLAKVIGKGPQPRTEVTKLLWAYIKKNNLQNPTNKRNILCGKDANLKALFDNANEVTMFEMTKLVGKHLTPAK